MDSHAPHRSRSTRSLSATTRRPRAARGAGRGDEVGRPLQEARYQGGATAVRDTVGGAHEPKKGPADVDRPWGPSSVTGAGSSGRRRAKPG
jgi:hypothetical protein